MTSAAPRTSQVRQRRFATLTSAEHDEEQRGEGGGGGGGGRKDHPAMQHFWVVAALGVAVMAALVLGVLLWAQEGGESLCDSRYTTLKDGVLTVEPTLRHICLGAPCPETLPASQLISLGRPIKFVLAGVELEQTAAGDLVLSRGGERIAAYLGGRGLLVGGSGDVTELFTAEQFDALPRGEVVLTGRPINSTVGPWRRTQKYRLSNGTSLYAVQHTTLPGVAGMQLADGGSLVTLPSDEALPVIVNTPSDGELAANQDAAAVVGGAVVSTNVRKISGYSCINTPSPVLAADTTRALVLRGYVPPLHAGFYGSWRDYNPRVVGNGECYRANAYQAQLQAILQQELERAQGYTTSTDLSGIFDGEHYFAVDTSSCVDATAEAVPAKLVFKFWRNSPACEGTPVRSVEVDLTHPPAANGYQLLCTSYSG